jgi:hypothetical protein
MRVLPPLGVLQDDTASLVVDNAPLFDLLQRSKASETDKVVVEAAISHARRLSGAVGITHLRGVKIAGSADLTTQERRNPGIHHTGEVMMSLAGQKH